VPYGYHGKILRVDLTTGETRPEEIPASIYRRYLGGSALASYFLLKELKPGVDPLGPENMLVVMTSVINGTVISGANRYTVAAKSPLTGGFGEAEAGGWFGPELKAAGYDGIIIKGQSDRPVYLWIHDGEAEIRDASKYWGQLSGDVQDGLEEELGDKRIRVLQCGISGERGVRYAALVNQLKHYHGRSGLGAVMGSKRLRAIVVRGKAKLEAADPEGRKRVFDWFKQNYDREHDTMHLYGTSRGIPSLQADGILPTRNFRDGNFEKYLDISGKTMFDTILTNQGTCYSCSVACKREVAVPELGVTPKHGGPEYETIAAVGSLTGVGNLKMIALANQWLSQYVLDSISTGAAIAFAIECYENGLLTKEDVGGLDLRWGNEEAVLQLIHMIGRREGIGALLGEGVKRAAEKIGRGAERFAMHVKGQEFPMHDPRGKKGLAIAYATSPTGADHMEAPHDPLYEGFGIKEFNPFRMLGLNEPVDRMDASAKKVRAYFYTQAVWSMYNCIGMCDFVGVTTGPLELPKLVEYVNAVTGWDLSLWEMLKVGERANTMARLFNVREGFTAADDKLPDRMYEPMGNGPLKGKSLSREEVQSMLRTYYQMCGWDPETGVPTPAKLAELELDWAVAPVAEPVGSR